MNLETIKNTLNTDKQCREYLAKIRWKNGFVCPHCQSREAWKTEEVKFKCKKCGHKISVTSGTVFQDSHTPLSKWFLTIWLIAESGKRVTADTLQDELNLGSNRTALRMLKILRAAQCITNRTVKLEHMVEISQNTIKFRGERVPILIAVEINGNTIRQIHIQKMEYNKAKIKDFIKNYIVPYDSVLTDLSPEEKKKTVGIVTPLLIQGEMGGDYNQLIKSPSYQYRHTRKVCSNFSEWINRYCPKDKFEQGCKMFCALHNRKFITMSFEEILENLLKLKMKK